jgi:hypothetical protein
LIADARAGSGERQRIDDEGVVHGIAALPEDLGVGLG